MFVSSVKAKLTSVLFTAAFLALYVVPDTEQELKALSEQLIERGMVNLSRTRQQRSTEAMRKMLGL